MGTFAFHSYAPVKSSEVLCDAPEPLNKLEMHFKIFQLGPVRKPCTTATANSYELQSSREAIQEARGVPFNGS